LPTHLIRLTPPQRTLQVEQESFKIIDLVLSKSACLAARFQADKALVQR